MQSGDAINPIDLDKVEKGITFYGVKQADHSDSKWIYRSNVYYNLCNKYRYFLQSELAGFAFRININKQEENSQKRKFLLLL